MDTPDFPREAAWEEYLGRFSALFGLHSSPPLLGFFCGQQRAIREQYCTNNNRLLLSSRRK